MSDTVCDECGQPWVCPQHGDEMIHHDMFGMAWCEQAWWATMKPRAENRELLRVNPLDGDGNMGLV